MVSPELLRRHPFFGGLKDDELAAIAMIAEECAFPDGERIFREGERAERLYILTAGNVDLVYEIHRPGGVDTSYVGSINTGEPFGISAFVEPYVFTATGQAQGEVKAIAIDAAALRALSEVDCHLGYSVMRQVAIALAERLNFARVQLAACG
jgi:CRP/FNR family transcriptional regulator, cyclic AMP receptor protein